MSFTTWVDERIANALTDERIKVAVDEAVAAMKSSLQIAAEELRDDVKAEIASLAGDLEKLPQQIVGDVNGTLARIEESVGGLQQFLNGLPHIPFLQ